MVSEPTKMTSSKMFRLIAAAGAVLAVSWGLMWTQDTFWNPVFFWGLWTGATLSCTRPGQGATLGGDDMPSWQQHQSRRGGGSRWSTTGLETGSTSTTTTTAPSSNLLLASLAFSTVVPALDSAWRMTLGKIRPRVVHYQVRGNLVYLRGRRRGYSNQASYLYTSRNLSPARAPT